jgi:hypothetical protein
MGPPNITFFCELSGSELYTLFENPEVIEALKGLNAGVSLGILDLSDERAGIVKRLNASGIKTIAWLLLPEEQGYWFNQTNYRYAEGYYQEFTEWSSGHGLVWDGIGLDFEPDIREMKLIARQGWWVIVRFLPRLFDRSGFRQAQERYKELVRRISSDGYNVDGYLFPVILDEREAGSETLQRITGLVDPPVDREVLMLYTSYLRPYGPGVLWNYAQEAVSIGIGNTGGGVYIGLGDARPLNWDELARDLRLAWSWCDDIHIFSLEGCVRQGFLERLRTFKWDQPMMVPEEQSKKVSNRRRILRSILWVSANLTPIFIGLVLVFITLTRYRRKNLNK